MVERETLKRQKLADYFRKNLEKGYDIETLKWALIKQGHSRVDVAYAIEQIRDEFTKRNLVKEKEKPIIKESDYDFEQPAFMSEKKPWWKFW